MDKIQPRVYPASIIIEQGFDFYNLGILPIKAKGKNKLTYLEACCGFDIETTNIYEKKTAYMYIWQFSFNDIVVIGRTWSEFIDMLEVIRKQYKLSKSKRLLIWVHNLGFEFQFLRHYFNITDIFAKEIRKPLYFVASECIEFRDSASISGGSLAQLAKDFTETQKMVGDLDYSIPRSSKTKLKKEELQYCINDVVILSEWARYIFDTYVIPKHFIPLTKTGILRREIKAGCTYEAKKLIYSAYPESHNRYLRMMLYLFRGGYTHCNITFADKIVEDVAGVDLTSSYPAQMFQGYYPVTPFVKVPAENWEHFLDKKCCILHLVFDNIKATTAHSIESRSKCLYVSDDAIIDNGRLHSASRVCVLLTELDYDIYTRFYQWSKVTCLECEISTRGVLPRYVLDVLSHAYVQKDKLKKAGLNGTPEYAMYKSYVNSIYGCLVTRLTEKEIILNDLGDWDYSLDSFDYERERKKAFLLPQWGCYCTSHARHTLLKMVYRIECERERYGGDVIYCDTDSIKMINYDKHKHVIDEFNAKTQAKMQEVCNKYDLPIEHFNDLGSFDLEYTGAKMKTLGAKRYITEYSDGHLAVTIAGLPKNSLTDYCKKYDLDIWETFDDDMLLNVEVAFKNASCYNDEPTSDVIEGVKMQELSSICIYPIDFTMTVSETYRMMIDNIKRSDSKYENRVYG